MNNYDTYLKAWDCLENQKPFFVVAKNGKKRLFCHKGTAFEKKLVSWFITQSTMNGDEPTIEIFNGCKHKSAEGYCKIYREENYKQLCEEKRAQ